MYKKIVRFVFQNTLRKKDFSQASSVIHVQIAVSIFKINRVPTDSRKQSGAVLYMDEELSVSQPENIAEAPTGSGSSQRAMSIPEEMLFPAPPLLSPMPPFSSASMAYQFCELIRQNKISFGERSITKGLKPTTEPEGRLKAKVSQYQLLLPMADRE